MGNALFPGMDHYSVDIAFEYGICVGPKIDYVAVQTYNGYTGEKMTVVLAKALLYTTLTRK